MLASIVTSTTTTSSISRGVLPIITPVGLPEYGVLAIIVLIVLLSVREVLSVSPNWSKSLDCTLKMAIMPLVIVFVAIVVFKLSHLR